MNDFAGPMLAALRRSARPAGHLAAPTSHVRIHPWLAPEELDALERRIHSRRDAFTPSQVTSVHGTAGHVKSDYRRSRVLYDLGPYVEWFRRRLLRDLPTVCGWLGVPPFPVTGIDVQATATNDGEYFRRHTDTGAGEVGRRAVSFTFFIHREPRRFSGGDLRIYPGRDEAVRVAPRRNCIVFFRSDILHEIEPVDCPTRSFADGRININGWILR